MASDYIPSKQALLSAFLSNFATLIAAGPGTYGLMTADATQITTYTNSFTAALTLVLNPGTKTKATVADKNGKKAAVVQVVRQYAQVIKRNLGVSDAAKAALGITLNDNTHTPVPAPSSAPQLALVAKAGGVIAAEVRDSADPARRAKPAGVQGTALYLAIGTTPPADPASLPLYTLATKSAVNLTFSGSDLGKTAYVYGAFYNPAGERGPLSAVASRVIGG